jgi:transposase-like protein
MSQSRCQRYNPDFKEWAIGILSLGKPIGEVAQDLQISTNLLCALRALRRENALLSSENDILKEAAFVA